MTEVKGKKVALIQGGLSAEREVSLRTGTYFESHLKSLGLNYVVIDANETLIQTLLKEKPDLALLALHGKYAEDGVVQGICEYLKIPYTGSGVASSALCMSKLFSKQLYKFHQLPTPDFIFLNLRQPVDLQKRLDKAVDQWGLPLVIKPSREGSSVGISICKTEEELMPAIELAKKYDHHILVEEFVAGKEVTVTVYKDESLTPLEISPKEDFYNYENKYTKGKTDYFIPARISDTALKECQVVAQEAAQYMGVRTYCRADFIVTDKNKVYLLEINTLPGCTETSLTPQALTYDKISHESFVLELLKEARLDYEVVN